MTGRRFWGLVMSEGLCFAGVMSEMVVGERQRTLLREESGVKDALDHDAGSIVMRGTAAFHGRKKLNYGPGTTIVSMSARISAPMSREISRCDENGCDVSESFSLVKSGLVFSLRWRCWKWSLASGRCDESAPLSQSQFGRLFAVFALVLLYVCGKYETKTKRFETEDIITVEDYRLQSVCLQRQADGQEQYRSNTE